MAITAPTYDPVTTAEGLAASYVSGRQTLLTAQTTLATATAKGLTTLSSALSAFETVMSGLTTKKSVLATSATFSSTVGTATASTTATPGSYQFYVEQLATANQASYSNLSNATPLAQAGTITVSAGTASFTVDLSKGDTDGDGVLSVKELALAINGATGNNAQVTASTITVNGEQQLVLASGATGAANTVAIDAAALPNGALKDSLTLAANRKDLVVAQDAIVYLGDKTNGTKLQQASNTYNVIDGVSMTFTKAQSAGENPVTLTVATDSTGTAANVQSFVDGFNKLIGVLQSLTTGGDAVNGADPGVFHSDAGIQSLQQRLQALLREKVDGLSLASYGITGNRDGTLSLDTSRLNKALAANPNGLDAIMGNNSLSAPAGLMGSLDKLTGQWTDTTGGQITKRRDSNTQLQSSLTTKQAQITQQQTAAYDRYLAQFSALAQLQTQMNSNMDLFDALFGNTEKS